MQRFKGKSGVLLVVLEVKNPSSNAGDIRDTGSIPELGRFPGGHGNPLQYSCLQNPMDRGNCRATVHGATKSRTQLSDFHLCNEKNVCLS